MNYPKIDICGNKFWENDKGEYHRIGGPAMEHANGDKYWYLNGKIYRLEGPAIELANGIKLWRLGYKSIDNLSAIIFFLESDISKKNK